MAIDIQPHAEGAVLAVKVQPGSRTAGLRGERAGALCLAVTVAPEKGKANDAVIELLARKLDIRRSQIELTRGATSRAKQFLIRGLSPAALAAKIEQALTIDE